MKLKKKIDIKKYLKKDQCQPGLTF
jgi:hypothetical protein